MYILVKGSGSRFCKVLKYPEVSSYRKKFFRSSREIMMQVEQVTGETEANKTPCLTRWQYTEKHIVHRKAHTPESQKCICKYTHTHTSVFLETEWTEGHQLTHVFMVWHGISAVIAIEVYVSNIPFKKCLYHNLLSIKKLNNTLYISLRPFCLQAWSILRTALNPVRWCK